MPAHELLLVGLASLSANRQRSARDGRMMRLEINTIN
jgi:hypothetical protein